MSKAEAAEILSNYRNFLVRSNNYEESQGGKPDRKLADALLVAIKALMN